ncbi:MAG: hypothetical protein ACKOC3_06715, partial [Candidatus Limnocylindrus sp.]
MSAAKKSATPAVRTMGAEDLKALRGSRIRAAIFAIFALAAFAAATANGAAVANLSLWLDTIGGSDALISFPVSIVWIAAGLVLGAVATAQYRRGGSYRWRIGFAAAAPLLVLATFTTLLSGTPANLTVLFTGTFNYAGPVAIGALAGIISERSGVVNIAIEGKFLLGALSGAVASSIFGMAIAGPVAGAVLGGLVGLLLAVLG